VVSTPALYGDKAIVGNRCYDLLGLDVATGEIDWKRYVWMSWVESNPVVRDGVAYVGSSDAAAVMAVDAATGRRRWMADVYGWSWGQPAVTRDRVYAGTSSQVDYLADHAGGVVALDRATGAMAWRYPAPKPAAGPYGFPGSPALGDGLVFVGGLDGRLLAFRE
jgi:outer membrane protein assembly factor BamB